MKTIVLVLSLLALKTCSGEVLDDVVRESLVNYQNMMNATGYSLGCCPKIVRPGPTGSVIAAYNGYRANVAIIVDWGTCPAKPPGGFTWTVVWDDGKVDYNSASTLGPFQVVHQYPSYTWYYDVTVYYCSNPPYGLRCCDVLYGTIITYKGE